MGAEFAGNPESLLRNECSNTSMDRLRAKLRRAVVDSNPPLPSRRGSPNGYPLFVDNASRDPNGCSAVWYIVKHNRIGADLRVIADTHRANDLRAGADIDVSAELYTL